MDRVPLSPENRQHNTWSRSALWIAGSSALLLTGFASGPDGGGGDLTSEIPAQVDHRSSGLEPKANKVALVPRANPAPSGFVPSTHDVPTIDSANFDERFGGSIAEDPLRASSSSLDAIKRWERAGRSSGDAADNTNARRDSAVHSLISVYSHDQKSGLPASVSATQPHIDVSAPPTLARPSLLSGIPEAYSKLALVIAGDEKVDPNWVLSVMRAENASFDPRLVSPAGAVGLMQVMPRIGDAFGANDLTDPEQNIRAGTRFLRILIAKYRNPVLVAAAYNAGEPNVDLRHSLPLIRETADYVTRVVGYYTGTAAGPTVPIAGSSSVFAPSSRRHTGPAERAKSPMLVFSVAAPIPPDVRPQNEEKRKNTGGPLKIVKEEVSQ
ncbi:lytic transglycosylase domain-containing protein [Rhizobium sp. WYJ-E13]|uniref:lytic transglycosylase domain-containing protein n=1 Tax=Rhizobium sp. WYJ-E13 TaxID=2849093 RepID=UPI001C1E90E6|nr:transglycosylase SLT domain-containing protein [Rhizobium sp. WYJ-E13]QWW72485.1 transglycosylase SLT domain-containing protein [Rhizobium sp. WYJ-E13]